MEETKSQVPTPQRLSRSVRWAWIVVLVVGLAVAAPTTEARSFTWAADLSTTAGLTFGLPAAASTQGLRAPAAVEPAGDVNGDGRGDVLLGFPAAQPLGRLGAGGAMVVFGHSAPYA